MGGWHRLVVAHHFDYRFSGQSSEGGKRATSAPRALGTVEGSSGEKGLTSKGGQLGLAEFEFDVDSRAGKDDHHLGCCETDETM